MHFYAQRRAVNITSPWWYEVLSTNNSIRCVWSLGPFLFSQIACVPRQVETYGQDLKRPGPTDKEEHEIWPVALMLPLPSELRLKARLIAV